VGRRPDRRMGSAFAIATSDRADSAKRGRRWEAVSDAAFQRRRRAAGLSAIPILSLPNPKEAANYGGLKSGEERPEKGASSRPRRWTLLRGQLLCQFRLWHGLAVSGTPLLRLALDSCVGCPCASHPMRAPAPIDRHSKETGAFSWIEFNLHLLVADTDRHEDQSSTGRLRDPRPAGPGVKTALRPRLGPRNQT
jgi:hypothetical protein